MTSFSTKNLHRFLRPSQCKKQSFLQPTVFLYPAHSYRAYHALKKPRRSKDQRTLGLLITDNGKDKVPKTLIKHFNQTLAHASRALYADRAREKLWDAYKAIKTSNHNVIYSIPSGAWRHLWKTQSSHRPNDPERLLNLRILVEDMKAVGLDVASKQEILRLEETFASGEQEIALKEWFERPSTHVQEEPKTVLDWISINRWEKELTRKGYDKEWLELGIRLYASAGRMTEMHSIITDVARRFRNTDPRFVVYLILFLTSTRRQAYIERAWGFFCSLLKHEKFTISLHDFDMILRAFLGAGALHHAAGVVCAAIVAHGKRTNKFDTAIEEFGCKVLSACTTPKELVTVALTILDAIPDGFYANPFFDTWIRKIKQFEDPHLLALIIELMYEKDSKVTAWHLNQLLTLLLNGSSEQVTKGEALAQAMIEKQTEQLSGTTTSRYKIKPSRIRGFFHRILPSGNINTYIELMKFYANQQLQGPVKQITEFLTYNAEVELNENAIRGILSIHLITGDMSGAWKFFSFVSEQGIVDIDTRTWAILWKGYHKYLASTERLDRLGVPTSRQLFKKMMSSLPAPSEDSLPLHAMYEHVASCFCHSDDTVGLWAAIEAMHEIFDVAPSVKTINIMVKHIAIQCSFEEHVSHAPRQLWAEHLAASIRILERCYLNLQHGGISLSLEDTTTALETFYKLDPEKSGDDTLQLVMEYLRSATDFVYKQPAKIQQDLFYAKKEMGIVGSGNWEDVLEKYREPNHESPQWA